MTAVVNYYMKTELELLRKLVDGLQVKYPLTAWEAVGSPALHHYRVRREDGKALNLYQSSLPDGPACSLWLETDTPLWSEQDNPQQPKLLSDFLATVHAAHISKKPASSGWRETPEGREGVRRRTSQVKQDFADRRDWLLSQL